MIDNNGSLLEGQVMPSDNDEAPDFTVDDLALLKEIFLSLEKVVDEIQIANPFEGGQTFEGGYIFTLLEKANVRT